MKLTVLLVISICSIWLLINFVEGFIAGFIQVEQNEWSRLESDLIEEHRQALIRQYQRENIHDIDR
jgi:hypothetical protein